MPTESQRVYLHVGLPKTGTTYLQELLWGNRSVATTAGLLYPGYVHAAHFHAAVDLQRDRYQDWVEPLVDGAWDRLVEHVRSWPCTSIISSELLATATAEQIARARASLSFAEVHVICTIRDLGRQVPSVWQENIRNQHVETYPEFLARIRSDEPSPIGELFWSYQDAPQVLRAWSKDIPAERVHVMTVPRGGGSTPALWRRFASVLGVPSDQFNKPARHDNRSLGIAEAELLRRLNLALGEQVSWPRYAAVVKEYVAPKILSRFEGHTPIRLPSDELPWVRERAERFIKEIDAAGYHVVGDLDELRPERAPEHPAGTEVGPTDSEILDAAVRTITHLVSRMEANPDRDHPAERIKHTLREFSEQHPHVMALRQLYWKGKAGTLTTGGRLARLTSRSAGRPTRAPRRDSDLCGRA